jgi:hypothetical protein
VREGTVFHAVVVRKRNATRFRGPNELIIVREVAGKIDRVVRAKRRGLG